jgi:hypothetical protein
MQNTSKSAADQEETKRAGKLIAGGLAAIDFAILIQLLSALPGLSSWSYALLWLGLLLLCVCIPVLTVIFGAYAVMPRHNDDDKINIKLILFITCLLSALGISCSIAAFHMLAGISFLLAAAISLCVENDLEKKAKKSATAQPGTPMSTSAPTAPAQASDPTKGDDKDSNEATGRPPE